MLHVGVGALSTRLRGLKTRRVEEMMDNLKLRSSQQMYVGLW